MKTPSGIITKFKEACHGISYGKATLTLTIKQGQPRYLVAREESFLPIEEPSTSGDFYAEEQPDSIKR